MLKTFLPSSNQSCFAGQFSIPSIIFPSYSDKPPFLMEFSRPHLMGTQMPKLEASSMANASLPFHCRPRVNVNDPPAFIIHEVKNAVGHVKKNATAWKIAMKKERPFFSFVWSIYGPWFYVADF